MEMIGNMVPRENGIQPPARIAPQPPQEQQGDPMQMLLMMLMQLLSQGQGQPPMQGAPMPPQMPAAPMAAPQGMEALLMGK